jgi:hypothetical protein
MTLSRSLALIAAGTIAALAAAAPASAQTVVCKNGLPDWAAKAYAAGGKQGGFHCEPAGVVQTGSHGWSGGAAALRAQQIQQQKLAEAKRHQAIAAARAEAAARQQAAQRAASQQQVAKVPAQDPAQPSASVAAREAVAEAKPAVRKETEPKTAAAKSDCRRFIPSLGATVEVPCGQ